ncbi:aminoglycoside phosphotransferase family protein [Marinobacter bohaiensis]|uniref:aminoglycoside phosphotransferase family protein n=1 Tax=Marinobacter bohaiensis TaxID=2201898 RepID=UPI000DAE1983|nr:phosphotransferase [Marinobacter bohaiensis]
MDSRLAALTAWVRRQPGFEQTEPVTVSGDASFRRYFRVTGAPEGTACTRIVMDAPPEKEDTGPFVAIARHWRKQGVNVPAIHAEDPEQGFLLLDDFGDALLLDHLTDDNAEDLYGIALDALARIQATRETPDYPLPPYNEALLDREMALFRDWLLERHLGLTLSDQEHCLLDTTFALLKEAALAQPEVPVHRDYHSRNLLVLDDDRDLGIIDFQDAVRGPVTYDLVSLIKDCYIRWPEARISRWVEQFRQQTLAAGIHHADAETFRQWVELMGMQRHLKASGIFARLYIRDGKPGYLADIPRTVNYLLEASARQPALRHFHDWLGNRVIPLLDDQAA